MRTRRIFNKAAILGLGLIGGSLGLAIRQRRLAGRVAGYARRAVTRRQALARGAVDEAWADPAAAVRGADLVVLCVPVPVMAPLLRACVPGLARRAVVTDVGSSKLWLLRRLAAPAAAAGACLVGGHPIAGSERQGLAAARGELFAGAMVVLTPTARTDRRSVRRLAAFWRALGARPAVMSPARHDRLLARTSHLPHLAAATLAWTVGRERPGQLGRFCGAGFRDATRIAESSPAMWQEIIASNRPAVLRELEAWRAAAARLAALVRGGDADGLRRFLAAGRRRRRALAGRPL